MTGWKKRIIADKQNEQMTAKKPFCQVCRTREAEKQVRTSDGKKMWRCLVCYELKNRVGFSQRNTK